ncbi:MAG: FMN-binding protein [Tissierellia bacterium]|nr:FMN-binding protein [Tissierellia bacterium]
MKKLTSLFAVLLVAVVLVTGCSQSTDVGSSDGGSMYKGGTYTATAKGNNGDVTVEVVFTDDAIKSITVVEHQETGGLGDTAMDSIINEILEKQTTEVDVVAGATNSCNAVIEAVEDCINQAKGN